MALVSKLSPETIQLPHEEGESITIRPVSWLVMRDALEAAAESRVKRAIRPFVELPPESIKALQSPSSNGATAAGGDEDEDEDAPDVYDRQMILRASIVEWSYEDPVTPANIDDLDDVTAELVYRRAVALNTRSKSEGEV